MLTATIVIGIAAMALLAVVAWVQIRPSCGKCRYCHNQWCCLLGEPRHGIEDVCASYEERGL